MQEQELRELEVDEISNGNEEVDDKNSSCAVELQDLPVEKLAELQDLDIYITQMKCYMLRGLLPVNDKDARKIVIESPTTQTTARGES